MTKEEIEQLERKVLISIHRIERLYTKTNGKCYLSFSGGKDSTVVMALIKMCSDLVIPEYSIPLVYADTGIELGATREFVKWCKDNYYPNIHMIRSPMPFNQVIEQYGKPAISKMKAASLRSINNFSNKEDSKTFWLCITGKSSKGKTCCNNKFANKHIQFLHDDFNIKISPQCCIVMKEEPIRQFAEQFNPKGYFTGMRLAEGGAREKSIEAAVRSQEKKAKREKAKGEKTICTYLRGDQIVTNPIVDWTDDDVDNFIEHYNVPLSKAYTEYGYKRTGCFLCPNNRNIERDLAVLHQYEPQRYKASIHWLKDIYIAQNVKLPFDHEYEKERKKEWDEKYYRMQYEMMKKYRPDKLKRFKNYQEVDIFFEDDGV